jgi:hypothetical protein
MDATTITWTTLLDRYEAYRKMPRWGPMRRPEEMCRLNADDLLHQTKRAEGAVGRVRAAIRQLETKFAGEWPDYPAVFFRETTALDRLLSTAKLGSARCRNLLDAVAFARDNYSCRYCGRNAFTFYETAEPKRTLYLVVDHMAAVGKDRRTYVLANCVTACWSCNTMKGAFPEEVFLAELDSIIAGRQQVKARLRGA